MRTLMEAGRLRLGLIVICVLVCCAVPRALAAHTQSKPAPPPAGQLRATWTAGNKDGFGTAFTYDDSSQIKPSRLWFTLTGGALSETYYPTLDFVGTQRLIFLATDGRNFIADETRDFQATVTFLAPRAPAYRVVSTDRRHHLTLTKDVVTDPSRDVLLVRLTASGPPGTHVYAELEPALHNTSLGSRGRYSGQAFESWKPGTAVAMTSTGRWSSRTVGYRRVNDGLTQLQHWHRLRRQYDSAGPGSIAATVELPYPSVTLALGFGSSRVLALKAVRGSLGQGFDAVSRAYIEGWQRYTGSLDNLGGKADELYYQSVIAIKAAEDKTHAGAIIAAPAHPWGNRVPDDPDQHGYALVWPRDLYHSAMGLLAAGDHVTAGEALDAMAQLQYEDGSMPQNAHVQGGAVFSSLQMDEVADPILLAWALGREDLYPTLVKRGAAYIIAHGPTTPQERWEENGGYSPATLAAEIASLVAAADMASHAGDTTLQTRFLSTADSWERQIEAWTYTTTGPLGDHRYYLRVSQGDPNADLQIALANGGGTFDEREIVDPSFLELVRLGIRNAHDSRILSTLSVIDAALKAETANGPSWHRYNHDGYDAEDNKGHVWPVLSGERGMYDLIAGDTTGARAALEAMRRFAGPTGLIPEQVSETSGKATHSAAPLIWAEAEYLILDRSVLEGKPFDQPSVVAHRYQSSSQDVIPFVDEDCLPGRGPA